MSPLPDDRDALEPGEAYSVCVQELHQPHPDYERVLAYGVLSLRDAVNELAHQIMLASRR